MRFADERVYLAVRSRFLPRHERGDGAKFNVSRTALSVMAHQCWIEVWTRAAMYDVGVYGFRSARQTAHVHLIERREAERSQNTRSCNRSLPQCVGGTMTRY
jgi:hypothetical protein